MRRWAILIALLLLAGCGAQNAARPGIQSHRLAVRYGGASTLAVGQSLYAATGSWANLSSTFTYQWKDCDTAGANCVNAAGTPSTNRVYTLVAGDAGDTIRVTVTGNNGGTQTSPQTGVVGGSGPSNLTLPVVSGSASQEQTLSTTDGTWTGATSFAYQWQRCSPSCANIASATSSTYLLASADLGDTIQVIVTATNASGSVPATSLLTSTVSVPGSPPDTSSGVSPVLAALTNLTNCCDQLISAGTPPVQAVWNANASYASGKSAASYPCPGANCIYKGLYFPGDAQPASASNYANAQSGCGGVVCTLSWFQTNHPDWIEWKCAASSQTMATAFANPNTYEAFYSGANGAIALDFANSAVLSWMETNFWTPLLNGTNIQHLDIDNFTAEPSNAGARCGHYTSGGVWVAQYNGTTSDATWRSHEISQGSAEATWVHANLPNVAMAGNLSWDGFFDTDEASIANTLDVWFDEQGFTCGNSGCNGGPGYHGAVWLAKAQATAAFTAAGKAWFDINQQTDGTTVAAGTITHADINWDMANFLLFKNSNSWLFICGAQEYTAINETFSSVNANYAATPPWFTNVPYAAAVTGTKFDDYYPQGSVTGGVAQYYQRDFNTGHAYVNPNSSGSVTVTLPGGTWHDLWGTVQGATVSLAPGTGLVIVP